ncbi:MAG: amidohydrolase family protein, partial [Candidatus Thorarchaeota archaeon]
MTVDYLLKNGLVIVEGEPARKAVALHLGKIEGIYSSGSEPPAQQVIDCEDLYILPGAIDIHVHLRDLNNSDKEDFATGTRAAAAGGVTTVIDMPNSNPPTLDRDSLAEKMDSAKEKRFVNVGFYCGIQRKTSDFDAQIVPDILGFKVYPHSPITKDTSYDQKRIQACLKLSKEHNIPLLLHPETGGKRSAPKTLDAFLKQHTCESEEDSIQQFLTAQSEIGGRLHIC